MQPPSVLGADWTICRELGTRPLRTLATVVGLMGEAHAWVFPGTVPKFLGHPVRPYLFLPPRTQDALEELGTELRPAQAGWSGLEACLILSSSGLWHYGWWSFCSCLTQVSRMVPCLRASWEQQDFVRGPSEYSAEARSQLYSSAKPSQGLPSRFGFRLYKCLWE